MYHQSPFWGRYCVTTDVAFYILAASLFPHAFGHSRRAAYAATAAVCALLVGQNIVFRYYRKTAHAPASNAAAFAKIDPQLPIVAASGLTFVEMGQYEGPALMKRVFYLLDREAAIRFAHATLFEDMADFQKEFTLPGMVQSYAGFIREHRHFLVFGTPDYPEDWLLRKLAADHASIRLMGSYKLPYKDTSLYEVYARPVDRARQRPARTGVVNAKS
jgi:hypothetical protein